MKVRNIAKRAFYILTACMTAVAAVCFTAEQKGTPVTVAAEAAAPYMKITCIDLGSGAKARGDAVLLESNGQSLLMDTGTKSAKGAVVRYLKSKGIKNLSLYISHFHDDHCDNAVSIINDSYFHINRVYLGNPNPARKYITSSNKKRRPKLYKGCRDYIDRYNKICTAARKKRIPVTGLRQGSSFSVGNVSARVLWDHNYRSFVRFDPYDKDGIGFLNNSSLVTKFTLGNRSFLTCGDIESSTERDLLASGANLSADIMKLSHHGMWTSNLDSFVQAVNPCYCFYSYKNKSDAEARKFGSAYETSFTMRRLAKRYNILGNRYNGTITYLVQNGTISVAANRHTLTRTVYVKNTSTGAVSAQNLVYNNAQPLFLDKRMLPSGTVLTSGTAEDRTPAPTGWVKDSVGWRYKTSSGTWLAGGWKTIGSSVYYFTAKGYRYEGWLKLKGKTYFMSRLGVRQTGWQMINGKFYYFSKKNAVMLTGTRKIGGKKWPLRKDGSLDLSKKKAPNINITTSAHRHTTK